MQTLPETPFQILLYWQSERHVYKRLVLPWQQLITDLTRPSSANENVRNILIVRQLTQS